MIKESIWGVQETIPIIYLKKFILFYEKYYMNTRYVI